LIILAIFLVSVVGASISGMFTGITGSTEANAQTIEPAVFLMILAAAVITIYILTNPRKGGNEHVKTSVVGSEEKGEP
jgi:hypothetical protein